MSPGDVVRLDGPPIHTSRDADAMQRQPKPGECGVVESMAEPTAFRIVWVNFPTLGRYCMFEELLTVVGHVE